MKQLKRTNIFSFDSKITFSDSLLGFEKALLDSQNMPYTIFFEFQYPKNSLKKVKEIILKHQKQIDFENLYFYNANDFVNIVLNKPIYLPKTVNLFINHSCVIGCNFCNNTNQRKDYLPLKDIQFFLSKYPIGDNINFNILGQGDPLFHPELLEILSYIKSFGVHVTFFSGGKALLFAKNIEPISSFVDEFKINLSSSNQEVYNKLHKNQITVQDFDTLRVLLGKIAHKTTFLTVLMKENITDLVAFYKMIVSMKGLGIEIKKNLQYRKDDVLNSPKLFEKLKKIVEKIAGDKVINISSNIGAGLIHYVYFDDFSKRSNSILDILMEEEIKKKGILYDEIGELDTCEQFGNSMDIIEDGKVAVCCKYEVSVVGELNFNGKYYESTDFQDKYKQYRIKTPDACKTCPMPVDRYKSILKTKICHEI